MDALVCGLPRSGTTLIANLMHSPAEGRICLVEPLLNGKTGNLKRESATLPLGTLAHHIPVKRFNLKSLGTDLYKDFRWAIKEVRIDRIRYAYEHCKPQIVIFAIRELHDIMLSSYNHAGKKIGVDNKVVAVKSFIEFYEQIHRERSVRTLPPERMMMQYEFFPMKGYLQAMGLSMGWPLNGDPNRDLKQYGRADEIREGFAPRIENPVYPEEVLEIVNQCPEYQEMFGYKK